MDRVPSTTANAAAAFKKLLERYTQSQRDSKQEQASGVSSKVATALYRASSTSRRDERA